MLALPNIQVVLSFQLAHIHSQRQSLSMYSLYIMLSAKQVQEIIIIRYSNVQLQEAYKNSIQMPLVPVLKTALFQKISF